MDTQRFGLIALGFATAVAISAFFAMLFRVDPTYADAGAMSVFYISVFMMVSGVIAWVFMLARARIRKTKRPLHYFFTDAVRQGAMVGAIVTLSLILQAGRNLNFVWVLLIIAGAFMVEAFVTRTSRSSS